MFIIRYEMHSTTFRSGLYAYLYKMAGSCPLFHLPTNHYSLLQHHGGNVKIVASPQLIQQGEIDLFAEHPGYIVDDDVGLYHFTAV